MNKNVVIKKGKFLQVIKEAFPGTNQPGTGIMSGMPTPNDTKNLQQFNTELQKTKTITSTLGVKEGDMSNDYNNDSEFYQDSIDNLLHKNYGMTYFKDFPDSPKAISNMSPEELQAFNDQSLTTGDVDLSGMVTQIKLAVQKGTDDSGESALREPYLMLQNKLRDKMNENIIKSPIFELLAETETPKISKKEILEFVTTKKKTLTEYMIDTDIDPNEVFDTKNMVNMDAKTRSKINNEFQKTGNYFDGIPLENFQDILKKYNIYMLMEDYTLWSGMLLGDDSQSDFELGYADDTRKSVIKNAMFRLSWYKMPSGRYELVKYIS